MKGDMSPDLRALSEIYALQKFGFALAHVLSDSRTRANAGEDVRPYLKKAGITVPDIVGPGALILEIPEEGRSRQDGPAMVFAGPGDPTALGITIGCIRPGGKDWKYCLECGWLTCKVVIHLPPIVVETPVP